LAGGICAALYYFWPDLTGRSGAPLQPEALPPVRLLLFATVNFCVAGFNLLPVHGLDGGRILRLIAESRGPCGKKNAAVTVVSAAAVGLVLAIGVWLAAGGKGNISLLLMGLYLLILFLASRRR
jgi:Zn-dependent protease